MLYGCTKKEGGKVVVSGACCCCVGCEGELAEGEKSSVGMVCEEDSSTKVCSFPIRAAGVCKVKRTWLPASRNHFDFSVAGLMDRWLGFLGTDDTSGPRPYLSPHQRPRTKVSSTFNCKVC